MLEEEAKTKWCPMVVFMLGGGQVRNRDACYDVEGTHCIGSACMMFRWEVDAEIPLSNGYTVIVDDHDAEWALSMSWRWDGKYPRSGNGRMHVLLWERIYAPVPEGMEIDHRDGNTLNCRRGNLRLATHAENMANSAPRGGASQYRGVFKSKGGGWAAQISKDGVRRTLGTFDEEIDAAKAYDAAAREIHGQFARPNLEPPENSGRHGYCGLGGKP